VKKADFLRKKSTRILDKMFENISRCLPAPPYNPPNIDKLSNTDLTLYNHNIFLRNILLIIEKIHPQSSFFGVRSSPLEIFNSSGPKEVFYAL
jgi:hypothetical protein